MIPNNRSFEKKFVQYIINDANRAKDRNAIPILQSYPKDTRFLYTGAGSA